MIKIYLALLFGLLIFKANSQDLKNFNVYWDNGLKIDSHDGNFKIKMGGRIQYDIMWIHQDDSLNKYFDAHNGAELRRARFYTSGTIYKNIKFKLQVDFAGSKTVVKDAYIRLTKLPVVGNIQVGNFKVPFGLTMLTSSKYITDMERPLASVFDNDRDLGFMIFNQYFNKRLSVYAGNFYPSDNTGRYVGNKYNLVFRITGLPVYNVEYGYKVLHIGASYEYRYQDNKKLLYSFRPEAHLAPVYLKATFDYVKNTNNLNTEFLFIKQTLSFESEFTVSYIKPSATSTLTNPIYSAFAYYGTISWFITGEHKNYVTSKTTFDRVTPKKNFGQDGGFGAIELSIRYSDVNLNDTDVNGGIMNAITGGINWYLNPAVKIAFNYVYTDVKNIGIANIFQMRFQVAF